MPTLTYVVAGARPNFMKIAAVLHELRKYPDVFTPRVVHTGQHYDYALSQVFLKQLGIGAPDYFLNVGSGSHAFQTGQVLMAFEKLIMEERPNLVIVVGDINSTLAAALAAVKCGVTVAHVEAGLRSFDMTMPEEINRLLTDRISHYLFVSEPSGMDNLKNEGCDMSHAHLVGNVMIDTLTRHITEIRAMVLPQTLSSVKTGTYAVCTLHRPSNVDDKESLTRAMDVIAHAARRVDTLLFAAHPRTVKNIAAFGLQNRIDSHNVKIVEPLGYFEFIHLVDNAKFVLTDSGGIQEETTWLGVPCITLRESTERPLTCASGTNTVTGLEVQKVSIASDAAMRFMRSEHKPPTLWDGCAVLRILDVLC